MPARDVAVALFIAVVWGFNFVVMKAAVGEVEPLLLSAVRFGMAGLIGALFVAKPNIPWTLLAGFGLAFGVAKFGLLFTAFKWGMPAGLASVVLQLQAVFTVLLVIVLNRELPTPQQAIGLGLATAGLGVIGYGVAGGATAIPVAMVVAAAAMWAIANWIIKRAGAVDMLGFTVWSCFWVPVPMLLLSVFIEGPGAIALSWSRLTWVGVGAMIYLVVPVSIVSGALWNDLLSRHAAAAIVPYALLVPVVGILSATWFYGERLTGPSLLGTVLVGLGLCVIMFGDRWRSRR
jgi:O-acetylserine/cysteine efflux transporter